MLKNRIFGFSTLILMLVSGLSCSKNNRDFIERRLVTNFEIPPGLNTLETHYFIVRDVPTLYLKTLEQSGLSNEGITQVSASKGELSLRLGGGNLAFISSVSVRAIEKGNTNNKLELFYIEQIPLNVGSTITLFAALSDIKNIVNKETMDMEIRLQFRSFAPSGISVSLDFGYLAFTN